MGADGAQDAAPTSSVSCHSLPTPYNQNHLTMGGGGRVFLSCLGIVCKLPFSPSPVNVEDTFPPALSFHAPRDSFRVGWVFSLISSSQPSQDSTIIIRPSAVPFLPTTKVLWTSPSLSLPSPPAVLSQEDRKYKTQQTLTGV